MDEERKPPQIPVRLERYHEGPPPPPKAERRFWLLPQSGLLILGIDWMFFAPEAMVVTLPIACFLAFVSTTIGVFMLQRHKAGDPFSTAAGKALFAGIIAGIPTSISGTLLGTVVLVLAGLRPWWGRNVDPTKRPVRP